MPARRCAHVKTVPPPAYDRRRGTIEEPCRGPARRDSPYCVMHEPGAPERHRAQMAAAWARHQAAVAYEARLHHWVGEFVPPVELTRTA